MDQDRATTDDRIKRTQNQLDEVQGIMADNIEKVLTRGDELDSLQERSEDLEAGARLFRRSARRLRNNMWWKDKKMLAILLVILLVIIMIIVIAALATK